MHKKVLLRTFAIAFPVLKWMLSVWFTCHQNVAVLEPPEMLHRATVAPPIKADRQRERVEPSSWRTDMLQAVRRRLTPSQWRRRPLTASARSTASDESHHLETEKSWCSASNWVRCTINTSRNEWQTTITGGSRPTGRSQFCACDGRESRLNCWRRTYCCSDARAAGFQWQLVCIPAKFLRKHVRVCWAKTNAGFNTKRLINKLCWIELKPDNEIRCFRQIRVLIKHYNIFFHLALR